MKRVLREAFDVAIPAAVIALAVFIAAYATLESVYGDEQEHTHGCTCVEMIVEQEGASE